MKKTGLADSPLFKEGKQESVSEKKQTPLRQHDSKPLRYHDSKIADIEKAVRTIGKEVCTYRLTEKEKTALVDIIYHYRIQKVRLSENEIARIGINFIIEDFQENKKESILSRIVALQKE